MLLMSMPFLLGRCQAGTVQLIESRLPSESPCCSESVTRVKVYWRSPPKSLGPGRLGHLSSKGGPMARDLRIPDRPVDSDVTVLLEGVTQLALDSLNGLL